MNTSEKLYYFKNGKLYESFRGTLTPETKESFVSSREKTSLLIDDSYFFYVGMAPVSVTGKKLRAVAENYLSVMFPGEMVSDFGVFQGRGFMIIFVLSKELSEIISSSPEFFSAAAKISTPFIELASRYEDFVFSDGERIYKKSGSSVSGAPEEEKEALTARDALEEDGGLKSSVTLPGIKRGRSVKTPFLIPAAALAAVYFMFLAGGLISVSTAKKTEERYETALKNVYASAGVSEASDPYGMLLYKSREAGKTFDGERVLVILSNLAAAVGDNAELKTISVRDKAVRVEGTAADFAAVEKIKKEAETKLRSPVSMDDTKKTESGVDFVMRYEQ